jgi:hypothetical protein
MGAGEKQAFALGKAGDADIHEAANRAAQNEEKQDEPENPDNTNDHKKTPRPGCLPPVG